MPQIKVIITGATGMVGEGVLFECLQNEKVSEVLIVSRRHYEMQHPKLKEVIVPDFFKLEQFSEKLKGFDGCFFCAGVSSVGKDEETFRHLTYDTTLAFASAILALNPGMVFTYVSGAKTDSSEKGKMMWARVKGKTENDLASLGFRAEYNFRPGIMQPFKDQKNWKPIVKFLVKLVKFISPKNVLTLQEVGRAMINAVIVGYQKNVLEIADIKELSKK
ncbi:MAG: NAD-dependent epimerase/dehydratase family protein [Ginsengibacter sp.]